MTTPSPSRQTPTKIRRNLIRLRRIVWLELVTPLSAYFIIAIAGFGVFISMMSISFPLEISLISGKTDGETKELLKALQYLAKALSIMGGILAFINRKNLLVYAVCLLLSTSAIDLGIDSFLYYQGESIIPISAKLVVLQWVTVLQAAGVAGLFITSSLILKDSLLGVFFALQKWRNGIP